MSSSAHLTLLPWLAGWEDPGLGFDVALHVGTLLAVLWYFWRDWWAMAIAALEGLRRGEPAADRAGAAVLEDRRGVGAGRGPRLGAGAQSRGGIPLAGSDRFHAGGPRCAALLE